MLSDMSCSHILVINALSSILFAIFFHSLSCLFICPTGLFLMQQPLCLILTHICLFLLCFFALGNRSKKKNSYHLCQRVFCLCSLLRAYGFRSYIQVFNLFLIYFVYDVRECSNFIPLHMAVRDFSAPFIEKNIFPPLYILVSSDVGWFTVEVHGFILGFLFCSSDLCVIFVLVPCCFDFLRFAVLSKAEAWYLQLCSSLFIIANLTGIRG